MLIGYFLLCLASRNPQRQDLNVSIYEIVRSMRGHRKRGGALTTVKKEFMEALAVPPSNRLHSLPGDREGKHTISVNGPWRLCFRFEDGDAYDLELVQYH